MKVTAAYSRKINSERRIKWVRLLNSPVSQSRKALRSSRQAGYHNPWSTEGNSVGKWDGDWASVDCSVDLGRGIRITRRSYVRSGDLPVIIIASFNLRGVSKSKDNRSYRWCCWLAQGSLPGELLWRYLKGLWWRHHTELSSILEFKRLGSWEVTTTST